jgi:hypothetical protein
MPLLGCMAGGPIRPLYTVLNQSVRAKSPRRQGHGARRAWAWSRHTRRSAGIEPIVLGEGAASAGELPKSVGIDATAGGEYGVEDAALVAAALQDHGIPVAGGMQQL